MKEIRLKTLRLKNFMAVQDSAIDFNGKDAVLFGRNGTGKSTHGHALSWLLTGKDLLGNAPGSAKFPIKTADESNNFIHNLEHEAETVLLIDGKEVSLKKVYREKWQKKRGADHTEMTGHETQHYYDGVPVAEKEYLMRLGKIADEQTWRLLIDPLFFAQDRQGDTKFTWKERRKILFDMFGSMTDEEIIAATPSLKELPAILNGRSLDDHKAVVKSRLKEVKKELDDIPVRINEAQRNLPVLGNINADALISDIAKLRQQMQAKQQELARIQAGGEIAEMRKRLAEAQAELIKARSEAGGETAKLIEQKRRELAEIGGKGSDISAEIKRLESSIQSNDLLINEHNMRIEELATKWNVTDIAQEKTNAETFVYEQSSTCPTCGQPLPEDQLEEARRKAEEEFNLKKAETLTALAAEMERIEAEGEKRNRLRESLAAENETALKKIAEKGKELITVREQYKALQQEITALQNQPQAESPEVARIEHKIQDIEIAIADLQKSNAGAIEKAQREIRDIQADIDTLEQAKAQAEAYKQTEQRIKELKDKEKLLAREHEKLEHELFLLDEFTRVKCSLLEENVNKHFKLTRWKLFREQVQRDRDGNPVLEECCEAFGPSGAGFNGGMSQGEQKRIGVDCINQLQQHFGIIAPIIIDGAESLTEPVETEAQVIRLKAAEGVDNLTVEVE